MIQPPFCSFSPQPDETMKCVACGRVVRSRANVLARCPAIQSKARPDVLCQLEIIPGATPGTTDCRCKNCGQVFHDAHPATLRVRCAKEGLGQPPNIRRAVNFGRALGKHWLDVTGKLFTGKLNEAYRTAEEIDAIFETKCKPCPLFNGSICTHSGCGCNIGTHDKFLNKLAWASEHCPDNPPKW